jgi:hypothetical protein
MMRGLTSIQRDVLLRAMPGQPDFVFEADDEELNEAHAVMTALGWLQVAEDDGDLVWTTTPRGRVALELDALVRTVSA